MNRLKAGRTDKSMVITGLRGVGKTVLLGVFRKNADDSGWVTLESEISKHDDMAFGKMIAKEMRRALFSLDPARKWAKRARRAAGVLRSFSLTVDPGGSLSVGLDVERMYGTADSGQLDSDLTDLFVALGEAAQEKGTGILLLFDEIHCLSLSQLEALIMGLHKCVQRSLPITLVGAGLPQTLELSSEAKSYSERLFSFPQIGALSADEAKYALIEPASHLGITFEESAIDFICEYTGGYPYFLQEYGKAVWNVSGGEMITLEDAKVAQSLVEHELDENFFATRISGATQLEYAYMRAMAELGDGPQLAGDVASLLDRTSPQVSPTRSNLIAKGQLYIPQFGYADFTVPQFARYLRRSGPLEVPKQRPKTGRDRVDQQLR